MIEVRARARARTLNASTLQTAIILFILVFLGEKETVSGLKVIGHLSVEPKTKTARQSTTRRRRRQRRKTQLTSNPPFWAHPRALQLRGGQNYPNDSYSIATDDFQVGSFDQDHESFQDHIDAWKKHQQEQYAGSALNTDKNIEPAHDADGRLRLLTSVSKGSRALIFFLLLWRDVHLYEVADTNLSGFARIVIVTPLCALFLANLAGVVTSLTLPGHSSKKRLKAILNLDKLVEAILIAYNFLRLTILPPKYVPREVLIANTLHSVFFLLQAQAFTRVTWDQITVQTSVVDSTYGVQGEGDDLSNSGSWNQPRYMVE